MDAILWLYLALSIGTVWVPIFLTRRMRPLHVWSFVVTFVQAMGLQAALFAIFMAGPAWTSDWPELIDALRREVFVLSLLLALLAWSAAGLRKITSIDGSGVVASILNLLLAGALLAVPLAIDWGLLGVPLIAFGAFLVLVWGSLLIWRLRRGRALPPEFEGPSVLQLIFTCLFALYSDGFLVFVFGMGGRV
jgi:hypothetical protein